MSKDPLLQACLESIITQYSEQQQQGKEHLLNKVLEIQSLIEWAFQEAINEPKITSRESLIESNFFPILDINMYINILFYYYFVNFYTFIVYI